MKLRPPPSTLFPYTTLFRSRELVLGPSARRGVGIRGVRPARIPDRPDVGRTPRIPTRSEEHTSELQSRPHLVCRLLLEKKKTQEDNLLIVNCTNNLSYYLFD